MQGGRTFLSVSIVLWLWVFDFLIFDWESNENAYLTVAALILEDFLCTLLCTYSSVSVSQVLRHACMMLLYYQRTMLWHSWFCLDWLMCFMRCFNGFIKKWGFDHIVCCCLVSCAQILMYTSFCLDLLSSLHGHFSTSHSTPVPSPAQIPYRSFNCFDPTHAPLWHTRIDAAWIKCLWLRAWPSQGRLRSSTGLRLRRGLPVVGCAGGVHEV